MPEPQWAPVLHGDRYDGQVHTTDRRPFWVFRRLHLTCGWCVEVRDGGPDGLLLDRRWMATSSAASVAVSEQRARLGRTDAATALDQPWVIEEPRYDLGVIVAHGTRGRSPDRVQIDGGELRQVCNVTWLPAGLHEVVWAGSDRRQVEVAPQEVVHVHPKWLFFIPAAGIRPVPPTHRCHLRSLRFDDGRLRGRRSHGVGAEVI